MSSESDNDSRVMTLTMNPSLDINTSVEQVIPNQKLRCERPEYEPGGGGINVSRAMHALGESSMAWYVAGGANGEQLTELLDNEGIHQRRMAIDDMTRENINVSEESGSQQFRFVMPGARMKAAEWEHCLEKIEKRIEKLDYLITSGSLPPDVPDDFYAHVAKLAAGTDTRIIVDTSGAPLKKAVDQGVYLIKPNMREVASVVEGNPDNRSDVAEAARQIIADDKCDVVVVSIGAGGALLITADGCDHISSPPVPIKSRVGAGDSMMAGIVCGLVRGESISRAVRFGIAAGAAAVMTPGTELCRRDDTERLFQEMIEA